MSAKNSPEWKWHLWRKDRKTGLKSYCGFFYDEKGAIANKRKREAEDKNGVYAILNYGPTELAKRATGTKPAPVRTQRVATTSKAEQAMAEARAEARRRDAERVKEREAKRKAEEARKAADREAMRGIREDAAKIIDKHKADEQADLEAGINR